MRGYALHRRPFPLAAAAGTTWEGNRMAPMSIAAA